MARGRLRRVKVAVASPYLNFVFLNFIFTLGRLSSDEFSLNLDVFLGHQDRLLIVDGFGFPFGIDFDDFLCFVPERHCSYNESTCFYI